jgi:DNA-binding PadR family transcriptional regulator
MPKTNKTKYVILGLLSDEPMSGYDIKERMKISVSHFWNLSYGQIYPTLRHMEKDGWVSKKDIINEGKPNSKVYYLSEKGKHRLREWLKQPIEEENHRYEILLKLYFGNLIPNEYNIEHIQQMRKQYQENIDLFTDFERQLRKVLHLSENHIYILMTILFGIRINEAQIRWCDEVMNILKSM